MRADRTVIEPPLMPRLTRLASLPERQTPLLIREAMHQSARLTIRALRPGRASGAAQVGSVVEGEYRVVANDRVKGDTLVLDREVSIAAGRVPRGLSTRFSRSRSKPTDDDAQRLLGDDLTHAWRLEQVLVCGKGGLSTKCPDPLAGVTAAGAGWTLYRSARRPDRTVQHHAAGTV